MELLSKDNYHLILEFLNGYTHSKPIIYSMIEGLYDVDIYVDDVESITYGILFTPFDFNYIFGVFDQEVMKETISTYLITNHKEEAIFFGPNELSNDPLKKLIKEFNGVVDTRVSLEFNNDKFTMLTNKEDTSLTTMSYDKLPFAHRDTPVAYIYDKDQVISFCNALMIGQEEAEIDVYTHEDFQKRGFAFKTSITLIEVLIKKGITPNWTCWKAKENSIRLAKRLGFENATYINAYIWVEDFKKLG